MKTLSRHQLVYLKKDARICSNIELQQDYVSAWIAASLPFIYTRQPLDETYISLGLTVFVHQEKIRLSVCIEPSMIEKIEPLPLLREIMSLPKVRPQSTYLDKHNVHVYGSFLFEYFGLPVIQPQSDLDILIIYENNSLLEIKSLIQEISHLTDRVIDGEIRFYNRPLSKLAYAREIGMKFNDVEQEIAMDISIKEILTDSSTVLVKTVKDVYLLSREKLYATYPALCG